MKLSAVVACLALTVGLAACGSTGSSSSSPASSSASGTSSGSTTAAGTASASSDSVQKAAQAQVNQYLTAPSSIVQSAALSAKPAGGKTIAVMDCGVPACTAWADDAIAAAKVLGWKSEHIIQGVAPNTIQTAWNQVVAHPPSAVVTIGIPQIAFAKQAAILKAHNIPIVNSEVSGAPGNDVLTVIDGDTATHLVGKEQADWVLSQRGSKADTVYITSPEFPVIAQTLAGFSTEYKKLCPSCKLSTLVISAAELGTSQPTTNVMGYLRTNPGVNYIAVGEDELGSAIPPALVSAGMGNSVNMVGTAGGPAEYTQIKNGSPYRADVIFPSFEDAWTCIDVLARHFVGDNIAPDSKVLARWLLTKGDIPTTTAFFPEVKDYQAQFEKLWKVS
jgi:hypothetical protein